MMRPINLKAIAVATLGVVFICASAVAFADDEKKPAPPAELQVWAIRGTQKNRNVDPELKPLADALRKVAKLTGFKLEKKLTSKTKLGDTFVSDLISDVRVAVTPKERKSQGEPKKDQEPKEKQEPKKEPDPKKEAPKKKDDEKGQPEAGANTVLQLQVVISRKEKVVSTQTITAKAGEFFLVAGPPLDGGDTLIVAVSGK